MAAGHQRGIDMEFEVETEATLGESVAQEPEDNQQSLGCGNMGWSVIVAEPVPALPRLGQPHTSAQAFDRMKHLSRLRPCSVEQQHLRPNGLVDLAECTGR